MSADLITGELGCFGKLRCKYVEERERLRENLWCEIINFRLALKKTFFAANFFIFIHFYLRPRSTLVARFSCDIQRHLLLGQNYMST